MKRKSLPVLVIIAMLSAAAAAGTISGKVTGVTGESVVYVDTIAGKTFPAPSEHPVMDQKGLLFQPHIMVVEAGTTVDFLNSDKVAHNVFWPSIMQGGKKLPGKNILAPGRLAKSVRSCLIRRESRHCCAMSIRRWPATLW